LDLYLNFANSCGNITKLDLQHKAYYRQACAIRSPLQKTTKQWLASLLVISSHKAKFCHFIYELLCMMFPLFYTWMDYYISILASLRKRTPIIILFYSQKLWNFHNLFIQQRDFLKFILGNTTARQTQPEKGVFAPPKSNSLAEDPSSGRSFTWHTHYYWVWTQNLLHGPRMDYTNKSSPGDQRE
jgi:hypothetical protein